MRKTAGDSHDIRLIDLRCERHRRTPFVYMYTIDDNRSE